jgi:hypothetical protein
MNSRDKDRAWRRYKELKGFIHDRQCTKSEMWKPTDHNVNKCMKEITMTTKAAQELKEIGKKLGEETNTERFRPRR